MDILSKLSTLLFQDISNLNDKAPEYVVLHRKSAKILDTLSETAGEDFAGNLLEVQTEIDHQDLLRCFLYGLQVGFTASKLGQGS